MLDEKKADETIELRGIFFDGEVYVGDKGVEQVSKLPTREEAIGQHRRPPSSAPAEARRRPQGPRRQARRDPQDDRREGEGRGGAEAAAPPQPRSRRCERSDRSCTLAGEPAESDRPQTVIRPDVRTEIRQSDCPTPRTG